VGEVDAWLRAISGGYVTFADAHEPAPDD